MKASVEIDAGVCGFHTRAEALCEDEQIVSYLVIASNCSNIQILAGKIASLIPLDVYGEISPVHGSRLLACCSETLKGCCAGCAVPMGLFKMIQVSAGLALPRGIHVELRKE